VRLAVGYASPREQERAAELAKTLGLPLPDAQVDALLFVTAERLELRELGPKAAGPIYADFASGKAAHRRLYGGGRGQGLARAVGLKKGARPSVLDATAGLGQDAFVLAALGCRVTMVERSPVVAALLFDALARAGQHREVADIVARMMLIQGDAIELLRELEVKPQVVYLDPMYPYSGKSALQKKEMRLFRHLVGEDEDAPRLLQAALEHARERVVVKRPRTAPAIGGPKPNTAIEGKTTRFDLYLSQERVDK
jgi:16S rRNA (guanine1516-N2)-methyltransferase